VKPARQAGATLVEVLVALVLTILVTLSAWYVYGTNQRAFKQGREKLLVQQNASFCLDAVARDVREAWRVDYVNSSRILLYDTHGVLTSTWEMGTENGENRVKRNNVSMAPEECTDLVFSVFNPDSSTVEVELELMDDAENRVRVMTRSTLRNHDVGGT
jgi:type II secretory pathway pseudopilin PulG